MLVTLTRGVSHPDSGAAQEMRHVAIDVLKASAILTVIWIHAFLPWTRRQVGVFAALGSLSRFAVPAFFFAAGFLHFRARPIGAALLARRLNRVVWPYLAASLIALGGLAIHSGQWSWADAGLWLLIGNCLGIYYFVPPFIGAVAVGTLLSWLPRLVVPLFALLLCLGLVSELGLLHLRSSIPTQPFLWDLRNPLRWWGYYVAGWLLARHIDGVAALGRNARRWAGALLLITVAVLLALSMFALPPGRTRLWVVTEYVRLYTCILGIFLVAFDWREHRPIRWLSDATYPLYLYHFFFLTLYATYYLERGNLPLLGAPARDEFVVTVAGGILTVAVGRWLLGRRARLVIG